jgi:flagellin
VRGSNISERNISDAISCLAIAQDAAKNINECQQRIRELAVQAANGTNTSSDRSSLNVEAQQLINAITSFANQAQFNGMNLLNGDFTSKRIQVGPNSTDFIDISIDDLTSPFKGYTTYGTYAAQVGYYNANLNGSVTIAKNGSSDNLPTGFPGSWPLNDVMSYSHFNNSGTYATSSPYVTIDPGGAIPGQEVKLQVNGYIYPWGGYM